MDDILSIIHQLEEIEIQFVSLKENVDTGTPTGKAMVQMSMKAIMYLILYTIIQLI